MIKRNAHDGWETVATVVSVVNPYADTAEHILWEMERHANMILANAHKEKPTYVGIGGWMLSFYQDDSGAWCARASIHDCLASDILRRYGKLD